MTKVGVGFSDNHRSKEAGKEAAHAAMQEAGLDRCDLVLVYSTSRHDPMQLRDGIRSIVGQTPRLIGGYAIGIITKDRLGYDGHQVGVAVMSSDTMQFHMFSEGGLANNEYNVGMALGRQIQGVTYRNTPNILLMYDGIRGRPYEGMAFNINLATPLLEGLGQVLRPWPPAVGVGMMGDFQGLPTYQWFDDRIEQHTAMALVLSGGVQMDYIIIHGCKPFGGYHTITKAEGNLILEIDGKPALELVARFLGPDTYRSWEDFPFFVTLGVNRGEKFGEFKDENYANRLVMGIDKERGGLIMFEQDLKTGSEIQLMRRSIDFGYMRKFVQELLARVENRKPFFALYIDCAGRTSSYSGTEGEEAVEIQKEVGDKVPLLGMYSGTEIAKVGSVMQPLDWTGVLSIFSE